MLRHRSTRPALLSVPNTRTRYAWQSERDLGFSGAELRFDEDGKLVAVDYSPAVDLGPVTPDRDGD
jgi:hypothetical protein